MSTARRPMGAAGAGGGQNNRGSSDCKDTRPRGMTGHTDQDNNNMSVPASKFIVVKYGANQEAVFNTWCTGQTLLNHIRKKCSCSCDTEGTLDLCDLDGNVCHLTTHLPDYATTFTGPRRTYILVKVDKQTGKTPTKYNFLLEEAESLHPELTDKLKDQQSTLSKPSTGLSRRSSGGKTGWAMMRSVARMSKSREGKRNSSKS